MEWYRCPNSQYRGPQTTEPIPNGQVEARDLVQQLQICWELRALRLWKLTEFRMQQQLDVMSTSDEI